MSARHKTAPVTFTDGMARPTHITSCLLLTALICGSSTAFAEAPVSSGPVVPRFQGPEEPGGGSSGQRALGFALLGSGAVSSGVGLFMLEANPQLSCRKIGDRTVCEEDSLGRVEFGAGLLIGGVFLSGVGFYLLVSDSFSTRTILTTPMPFASADRSFWRFGVHPTPDGGLLGTIDYNH